MKTFAKGAEATILKRKNTIIKDRIPKSYRNPEIDKKLRKTRTKAETKLLAKAIEIIPSPKVIFSDNTQKIEMQYIPGKKLSDFLEKLDYKKICKLIGLNIAKLHDAGIIHGDLTTSNMIWNEKSKKVFFIDFGLGFHSDRIEDKAVDLHLIKQALEARHSRIFKKAFSKILEGYKTSKNFSMTMKQLEKVERRGRYKQQY